MLIKKFRLLKVDSQKSIRTKFDFLCDKLWGILFETATPCMYITKMLYNSSVLKEVFRLDFLDGLNLSHKSSLLFSPCLNVMENKVVRVNMEKTKVMICGKGLDTIKPSGKYPCSVCRKGVGRNSIFCTSCDAWVNKKCSGIKEGLLTYQVLIVTEI